VQDREALKRQMLRHLGVPPEKVPRGFSTDFELPPFERATLHNVLAGDVYSSDIRGQLVAIDHLIRTARKGKGTNDVVLLYYHGGVARLDGRLFLHTTQSMEYPDDPAEIAGNAVATDRFPPLPGVRLLLLNVVGPQDVIGKKPLDQGQTSFSTIYVGWAKPNDGSRFQELFGQALQQRRRLADVASFVVQGLSSDPNQPNIAWHLLDGSAGVPIGGGKDPMGGQE
jgi:hypothetical protein